MIPLRDNIPHYTKPVVTVALLIVNIVVYLFQMSLGAAAEKFIFLFGVVPARLFAEIDIVSKIIPLFSSMFLHGSLTHVLGNCLFLWIFADNVEDRLGHFKFLIFYILCGLAAIAAHALFNLHSEIPAIGASGAIAGVLGAYFILFPRARVLTLIPLFFYWPIVEIPAFAFLGIWFIFQFLSGVLSIGMEGCCGIAFWAHIGGFVAGILLLPLMVKRRRRYRY